jgi:hypothetical protein
MLVASRTCYLEAPMAVTPSSLSESAEGEQCMPLSSARIAQAIARIPTKRLATMRDVVSPALFLLDNQSINGVNLNIDNGWLLT